MDLQALQALLLSIIAGSATLIGAFIVIIIKGENKKFVSASLGFAAGIMISVSMLELFSKSNEANSSSDIEESSKLFNLTPSWKDKN